MTQGARVQEPVAKKGVNILAVGGEAVAEVQPLAAGFVEPIPMEFPEAVGEFYAPRVVLPEPSLIRDFLIRTLDVIGSFAILLVAAPVMLLMSVLIKVTSYGPVLYKQERVGKDGKPFMLYKFRTMIDHAEDHTGPVLATPDDPRVTPVGRLLRRTRIDEMPQLLNVFKGDMSLVGPRPEREFFVQRHKALQGVRLSVKPGITGLAQVRSFYDLKPAHKVKYDYLYIQNRSLWLNLYILLKTFPVLFTKKGW